MRYYYRRADGAPVLAIHARRRDVKVKGFPIPIPGFTHHFPEESGWQWSFLEDGAAGLAGVANSPAEATRIACSLMRVFGPEMIMKSLQANLLQFGACNPHIIP